LGLRHLAALDEARRNHHWDELWLTAQPGGAGTKRWMNSVADWGRERA
jgi:hypothetical protein